MELMRLFDFTQNNLNRRVVASLLVVFLLLAAISPVFISAHSPKIEPAGAGFSSSLNSYDFVGLISQPRIEYSPFQSRTASDFTSTKKSRLNETLVVFQNYAIGNRVPRLLGPAPVLPTSLPKDIKFFYLSTDIPPPFSTI